MHKKLGEKIVKLRTRTYKIVVSYFPEYKKNSWEAYRVYDFGLCEKINIFTRAEEKAFPKTLGYIAEDFLRTFK